MAERGTPSLLEFSIAASLAVVPVMLSVLLLVAVVRPAEPGARVWQSQTDRYVSVRHVAALKTFEQATLKREPPLPRVVTEGDVLAGIPQCRREWGPPRSAEWLAQLGDARPRAATTAAQVAAQLSELDAALLRFSTRPNARVGQAVGLDLARWTAAASTSLDQAIETPDYAGRQFRVRCADLVAALAALSRADARMLEALSWRGTESSATLARWTPEQQMQVTSRHVMRRNPWSGMAGCIYLGRRGDAAGPAAPAYFLAGERSAQRRICARPEMFGAAGAAGQVVSGHPPRALAGEPSAAQAPDDERWMVPASLQALLQPLEQLRQPSAALYHLFADGDAEPTRPLAGSAGHNRIVIDGAPVDVGFSIDLTIDPQLQALAQKAAACYTGRQDVCQALGLRRNDDKDRPLGAQLLEGAMVRTAAVAVIDVASGRIEALAGTMSPCARQEVEGPVRGPGCDQRLPFPARYRPDALLNPAVFQDAMPASTIKPIMAAAFLSDPEVGAAWLAAENAAMRRDAAPSRDSLRGQLMRSDSARFLDRMFCSDKGYANCRRAWDVQTAAAAFGWNAGCADGRLDCGKQDLLFGRAVADTGAPGAAPSLVTPVAFGRLLSEPLAGKPGAAMHLTPFAVLKADAVRRCSAGPDGRRLTEDDWEKCKGGAMVDVVAEGWGQGHARATALGVAGMMAALAAAANGQAEVRRPHLVESLRGASASGSGGTAFDAAVAGWQAAAVRPNRIARDAAEMILSGLSYSHRAGTARTACEQVFDPRRCREIDWLAGKTGTPSFPNDGVSLDELQRLCAQPDPGPAAKTGTCSSLRPYKWYVAAYRSNHASSGAWDKVIAVLTERNWLKQTGQVYGVGDQGPNPSAEIALQIAGRQVGLIAEGAP